MNLLTNILKDIINKYIQKRNKQRGFRQNNQFQIATNKGKGTIIPSGSISLLH